MMLKYLDFFFLNFLILYEFLQEASCPKFLLLGLGHYTLCLTHKLINIKGIHPLLQ